MVSTLLQLFNERRDDLRSQIDQATSLDQVPGIVARDLRGIQDCYVEHVSPPKARLAIAFLDTLRSTLDSLTATKATLQKPKLSSGSLPSEMFLQLVELGLCGILFVSLLSVAFVPALLSLIVFGLVGRNLYRRLSDPSFQLPSWIGYLLSLTPNSGGGQRGSSTAPEPPRIVLRANPMQLLKFVGNAFDVIDRALGDEEKPIEEMARTSLESEPEILDFLHELIGCSELGKPEHAIKLAQQLPHLLQKKGLRVEKYPREEPSSAPDGQFVCEPSPDGKNRTYVTIKPALVTADGNRVVRPGRVIEPG
jgi:hypothetical protein